MAFTAVAAVISAGTAVTATMAFAAVAEIGLAMTVVGAVTGNKECLKIGGTLGLVGGVGGLVGSAMSAGAAAVGEVAASGAAEAATGAADAATGAAAGAADAAGSAVDGLGQNAASNIAQDAATSNPFADKIIDGSVNNAASVASDTGQTGLINSNIVSPTTSGIGGVGTDASVMGSQSAVPPQASVGAEAANGSVASQGAMSAQDMAKQYAEPGQSPGGYGASVNQTQNGGSFFDGLKSKWGGLTADQQFKYGSQGLQALASIPSSIAKGQREDRVLSQQDFNNQKNSYGSSIPVGHRGGK